VELKKLSLGDEEPLEAFLVPLSESSLFLRSNARAAGLVDRGEPFHGTWVAAFETGSIVAVAAHFWNGMLALQAPVHTAEVARAAAARSGRTLSGLTGPWGQVRDARRALGRGGAKTSLDSREELFSLELARLLVPRELREGRFEYRHPRSGELELLGQWRAAFSIEALGAADRPELSASAREEIARLHERGSSWVLLDGGRIVAFSAFNAELPEIVQIGGVWTPPELRGRGYGRAVVAGSLLEARRRGVERAVLFTGEDNRSARAAYEALGFRVIGDYGLVMFA